MNRRSELQGVGSSPGIAVGSVRLLFDVAGPIEERRVDDEGIPGEIARFQDALLATRRQLEDIRQHVGESIDEQTAAIFDAHVLIIDDSSFIEKVIDALRRKKTNVEAVLNGVMDEYVEAFAGLGGDLEDLLNRILRNLAGRTEADDTPEGNVILVARDVPPSLAATLETSGILGIVTEQGGQTSHAAIMARALEVPAVAGVEGVSQVVESGDTLLIDGTRGRVIVNPTPEQLATYGHTAHVRKDLLERIESKKHEPAETGDGRRIRVHANLELIDRVGQVCESGADGIGLLRTEFLFLSRPDLPSEDEQADAYESVAQAIHPAPLVIRTLDIGGDKLLTHGHLPEQSGSPLGCRGIRLSLQRPDVFKPQLRAILRAARLGNVHLMYPMVSGVGEIREANSLLCEASDELRTEGIDVGAGLQIGAMLEIPSAVLSADLIVPEVSFFSLGTNDLVQYAIAADRLAPHTAALYEPMHPGVLRLIKQAVDMAAAGDRRISVCGEMASSPLMLPLLIGLGVMDLSVAPGAVPLVKSLIRSLQYADAVALAGAAVDEAAPEVTLAACRQLLESAAPDLKELLFP